jgi:hypothetical protein
MGLVHRQARQIKKYNARKAVTKAGDAKGKAKIEEASARAERKAQDKLDAEIEAKEWLEERKVARREQKEARRRLR